MAEPNLDLGLEYTGGINKPQPEQDTYVAIVDGPNRNLIYVPQSEISGGGGGGGGSPGGAKGDVQYNDGAGGFSGEAAFNYDAAANQLAVPGLTVAEDLIFSGVISPAQITTSQNDYSPTGFATAAVLRLTSDQPWDINGLAAGANGRIVQLDNVNAANVITLNHQSGSSTAANRIITPTGNAISIPANGSVWLRYDGTSSRWRVINQGYLLGSDFGGQGGTSVYVASAAQVFSFLGTITPTQLAANTNNWTPTGNGTASTWRVSTDASRELTGIANGTIVSATGRLLFLENVGSNPLVLKEENASSTAANRFALGGSDVTLTAGQSAVLIYDGTSTRWRLVGGSYGATVANDSITFAKMQNVSAASRLLGRGSAGGAGDPEELSLGAGLTLTGTALTAGAMADTNVSGVKCVLYNGEIDDGNSSTADTIDWSTGGAHKSTLTGNCTYTFTSPGGVTSVVLKIIQGAGPYTVTWPASVKWAGGVAPTLSTANGAIDIFSFYFDGTNYYGAQSVKGAA